MDLPAFYAGKSDCLGVAKAGFEGVSWFWSGLGEWVILYFDGGGVGLNVCWWLLGI